MFESDFLTNSADSKTRYQELIGNAAAIVADSLPDLPYAGKTPSELSDLITGDFLPKIEQSPSQIADILRTVISDSINLTHPNTAAHLHCPPLFAALEAEVIISALNQSMDSFDQAPIATILEQKMVRWLCAEAGLPDTGDGTFTTGGSQSNYMGLLLARDAFLKRQWNWSAQKSGLPPDTNRLRILCSEVSHFTVEKSASQLGLGTDAVIRIAVDNHFHMDLKALHSTLESLRAQNLLPIAIVATAGTTDFGSIDPLAELAEVADSAGAWLHVDAAYGGALLFSPTHRSKLTGIESADSLSIDFHKLLWQPIPCSSFLVRDARNFDFIKMHADYLNPELHEDEGIPNLVTTSLLTSRRFDALKLWISFQTLGREKIAAMIDRTIELAANAARIIQSTSHLELISPPQLSTVVFRYRPQRNDLDADRLNATIRHNLFNRSASVIGHTRVHGRQCLKFTFMNPSVNNAHIQELVEMVITEGRKLE
ncbi:MAG TPA: aspartate aminotransferase family protein [Candidatus Sulfotelmatobacter sp.]|nr:aspartate aminotransferase family protein [Candidatus Sulfotelmatobacter sp.]